MKYIKKFEKAFESSLMDDINNNNIVHIKRLIDSGVDLDVQDNEGDTALTWAAYKSNKEIVELLITAGASLNVQDNDGNTALILSLFKNNNNIEIAKILTKAGADWSIKNNDGYDFFNWLIPVKQEQIIKLYPKKYKEYLINKDSKKFNI